MQRFFNIFVIIALIALGILLFMLWRSILKLQATVEALPKAPVVVPDPTRTINGGDWWKEIKDSAENLTIEVQLK